MKPSDADDSSLLEAARDGDRDALGAWLMLQQPRIYAYAMRMCRNPDAAEEVLQDTLLAVARNLDGFRGDASPTTWLFTIARNACSKHWRRNRKHTEERSGDRELDAIATSQPSPEARAASHEITRIIEDAIDGLEPDYREAFILRDVQGLTTPEVAQMLGITQAAVKSRLHRARARVREQVAPAISEVAAPPSPTCPDIVERLSRYLEGELSPTDCAVMEHHVSGCKPCEARSGALKYALAMCHEFREAVVPPDIQDRVREALRAVLADRHAKA